VTDKLLLDTHTWIWYATGDKTITNKIKNDIEQARDEQSLFIAAISLWEISMLEKKGRIVLNMPCLEWIDMSMAKLGLQVIPLTAKVAVESCNLPGDFHGDPADRLIVATARHNNFLLLTRDTKIVEYSKASYCRARGI